MIEDATCLVSAAFYIGLLWKLKEPIYAIMISAIAGILIGVALMLFKYMGAKGRVQYALIDFASSWELSRVKEPLNVYRDILPTVKKGETIKEAVENVPLILTSRDYSCALDIATQLGLITASFEANNHSDPFGSGAPVYNM